MPVAKNHLTDFFVYALTAGGHPFYVGLGRARRAELRVPWVQSQIARDKKGRKGKWVKHIAVMRELLELGIRPKVRTYKADIDRETAKKGGLKAIRRLKRRGAVLANKQQNADSVADIVADLVRRIVADRIERRRRGG
jgi:hypothetical protein